MPERGFGLQLSGMAMAGKGVSGSIPVNIIGKKGFGVAVGEGAGVGGGIAGMVC